MTVVLDQFVEDARAVSIEAAALELGLVFTRKRFEHPQPCPACGGTDTFAFNTQKNAWNCRHGGAGGRDAIGMAAHCLGLDLARRPDFLEACAAVLGAPVPDEGSGESEAERAARRERLEARRRENERQAAARDAAQADFREREREKARGIYAHAAAPSPGGPAGAIVRRYLAGRGVDLSSADRIWRFVRAAADLTYWHGQDEAGRPMDIYSGPAMVLPFLAPDLAIIGCHITWIDLANPPKLRPVLYGLTKEGAEQGLLPWTASCRAPSAEDFDAGYYEILPTKKMRGSKKGGIIPLSGDPAARRWVGAEGIENTLAFAGWEEHRADTFYFAAGDLGNLSGPADPASRFAHPTLTKVDAAGRTRPVMVAGPVPLWRDGDPAAGHKGFEGRPSSASADAPPEGSVSGRVETVGSTQGRAAASGAAREAESMWVGDQIDELVLLADGDSERVMTAAAMARAKARHARPGRRIFVVWPKRGMDLSEIARQMDAD